MQASKHFASLPDSNHKIEKEELEYNYVASALLSWMCLESYVNAICESLTNGTRLTDFQKAFLLEEEYRVNDSGEIKKIGIRPPTLKKILFVVQYFSGIQVKDFKKTELWLNLQGFEDLRNKIVHHKEKNDFSIQQQDAMNYNNLVINAINYFGKLLTKSPKKKT
jgi:hypothetical protein